MARVEHATPIEFDRMPAAGSDRAAAFCALDEALETLSKMDPRRAQIIELRFFGGLSVEETAEVVGISPRLVLRDWKGRQRPVRPRTESSLTTQQPDLDVHGELWRSGGLHRVDSR